MRGKRRVRRTPVCDRVTIDGEVSTSPHFRLTNFFCSESTPVNTLPSSTLFEELSFLIKKVVAYREDSKNPLSDVLAVDRALVIMDNGPNLIAFFANLTPSCSLRPNPGRLRVSGDLLCLFLNSLLGCPRPMRCTKALLVCDPFFV